MAALAVLVYRDSTQLRSEAGALIETASAFASEKWAQWQTRSAAPGRAVPDSNAASVGAPDSPPVPSVATTDPAPAVPPDSTADERAALQIAPETAASSTNEAAEALPAPLPGPSSLATAAPPSTPRFEFAERTVTVGEGEASARIVIRRVGSLDGEASVVWWAADGTASADDDYAVLGARVERFAAGEESRVVYVPLIADSVREQRESFVVNLGADRAGARMAAQLEVVVLDDDF